jgi:hypothetical protein
METGTLQSIKSHDTLKTVPKTMLNGISTSSLRMKSHQSPRSLLSSMEGFVKGIKRQLASPCKPVLSPKNVKLHK